MSLDVQALLADLQGFEGQLLVGEPLAKHTYYRIGGPAELLAIPKTEKDLVLLKDAITGKPVKFFLLGAGSNVLAADAGYDGLVIKTARLNLVITAHDDRLATGASVAVSTLLRKASQEGWGGLEFLTGIPGSIGGVIAMNAGTHLGEAQKAVKSVRSFSLLTADDWVTRTGAELTFEYRRNTFMGPGEIVYDVDWNYARRPADEVKALIDETLARRKATQPLDAPSCGSVFKNPSPAIRAWETIDKLGLRGRRIGGAAFSDKHPNFIVNLDDARAADVRSLIDLAKKEAKKTLGIELHEEVKYLE